MKRKKKGHWYPLFLSPLLSLPFLWAALCHLQSFSHRFLSDFTPCATLSSPHYNPLLNPSISCTPISQTCPKAHKTSSFLVEMDQKQAHNSQATQPNEEGSNGKGQGGFLCRQSSTRWTPTTDQIRILKDLYYNNGVRSPSADQIQRISARLRQYGKIEGKNVFYWFQNHKARERQKKRFTSDHHNHNHHQQHQQQQHQIPIPKQQQQQPSLISSTNNANWKPEDSSSSPFFHNKYPPNISPGD